MADDGLGRRVDHGHRRLRLLGDRDLLGSLATEASIGGDGQRHIEYAGAGINLDNLSLVGDSAIAENPFVANDLGARRRGGVARAKAQLLAGLASGRAFDDGSRGLGFELPANGDLPIAGEFAVVDPQVVIAACNGAAVGLFQT